MNKKHKKHPPADRLKASNYHRNEFGIYGTDCASINTFVTKIQDQLSEFKTVYIDADHNAENHNTLKQFNEKQFHFSHKAFIFNQDKVLESNNADVTFVNGNHYPASNQIVFINPKKEASLLRRIDQLDSIFAIIIEENEDEIYSFLNEKINNNTSIYKQSEIDSLIKSIRTKMEHPPLKALILAGGKSMRMGEDKTQIPYNGKNQTLHIKELCEALDLETFISRSSNYEAYEQHDIKDRLVEMGPLGGIISAFMKNRNSAWLVIASDMPFVTKESIQHLVNHRKTSSFATTYVLNEKAFPEPTFTIYEPKIYKRILEFLSLGYTCPRKVLINSEVHKIIAKDSNVLRNVNTPDEKKSALKDLNK